MGGFSNKARTGLYESISKKTFDVCIIGAGIKGAAIALDAASRGFETLLLEEADFTQLHSAEVAISMHSQPLSKRMIAREKQWLTKWYPHVIAERKMPFIEETNENKPVELLHNVNKSIQTLAQMGKKKPINKERWKLKSDWTVDVARLTIDLLKDARNYYAKFMNYAKVSEYLYEPKKKLYHIYVEDQIDGENYHLKSYMVIDTTSSSENMKRLEEGRESDFGYFVRGEFKLPDEIKLSPAVIHSNNDIYQLHLFERKAVFTAIINNKAGTYNQSNVKLTLSQLLATLNENLTISESDITINSVEKYSKELKRLTPSYFRLHEQLILVPSQHYMYYRDTAKAVVDKMVHYFKKEKGILYSSSIVFKILGTHEHGSSFKKHEHKNISYNNRYERLYGNKDLNWLKSFSASLENEANTWESLKKEIEYAMEEEGIYTAVDFLVSRTGLVYTNPDLVTAHEKKIINLMARFFGWSPDELAYYKRDLKEYLK
ncbi:FAD-dependent oxidoreductase [Saliterribacillus persicus]|uniref:FAD-dependent oxidoreductase n=1 Tax=Saliterribacillus persicus TaxID=930114 RepID=UPI0014727579|nr:FAD-dependent oxidoreductase [Saliterribacillus persicus]